MLCECMFGVQEWSGWGGADICSWWAVWLDVVWRRCVRLLDRNGRYIPGVIIWSVHRGIKRFIASDAQCSCYWRLQCFLLVNLSGGPEDVLRRLIDRLASPFVASKLKIAWLYGGIYVLRCPERRWLLSCLPIAWASPFP